MLFLTLFAAYAYFSQGGGWNQNARFDQVRALAETGTFKINDYLVYKRASAIPRTEAEAEDARRLERHPIPEDTSVDRIWRVGNTGDVTKPQADVYPGKPPGTVLLAVPAYWLIRALERLLGVNPDDWWPLTVNAYLTRVFSVGLIMALGGVVFHRLSRRLFPQIPDRAHVWSTLSLGLATITWPFATLFFDHDIVAVLLLAAFALLVRERDAQRAPLEDGGARASARRLVPAGALVGLATITNYLVVVPILIFSLYLLLALRRRWRVVLFWAGGVIPAIFLAWYHAACFGSMTATANTQEPGMFQDPNLWLGMFGVPDAKLVWGLLVSSYRGLFFFSPVLILALVGLIYALIKRMRRGEVIVCLATFGAYLAINASFQGWAKAWAAGWSFGPRYLIPSVVLLALPLGLMFARLPRLTLALAAWSFVMTLLGTAVDPQPPVDNKRPVTTYLLPLLRGQEVMNAKKAISGVVSASPIGVYEGFYYRVFPRGSEEVSWNAFNLGEFLWPGSRLSVVPLLVVLAGAVGILIRWTRAPPGAAEVKVRVGGGSAELPPADAAPAKDAASPALPSRRPLPGIIGLSFLALLVVQCLLSMRVKSVTYDEPFYISAGHAYLTRGRFELNREHPPLMKYLIGIPLLAQDCLPAEEFEAWSDAPQRRMAFGAQFLFDNRPDPDTLLFWARVPTVVISMTLGLLVWIWTRHLYGVAAAGAALFLYCFSPNILAHSRLATLDLGLTAAVFAASYALWRLYGHPGRRRIVWAGIALAAVFLMKYTAVVFVGLVPLFLIGAIVHHRRASNERPPAKAPGRPGESPRKRSIPKDAPSVDRLFLHTAGVIAVALLGITFAYGFRRFGLEQYLSGFELGVLSREELTKSGYQSFLWGRYSTTGFRGYHLAAFLIKTPVPMLLLTVASIIRLMTRRHRRWFDEMFLVAPVLAMLAITAPVQKNFGLRNILPVYPFLFVLGAGTLAAVWRWRAAKIAAPLLGCWYVFSTVSIHPDYLPYFNELVGGPANGIRYLDDSNIDWGQDLKRLARYVREQGIDRIKLEFFGKYWLEPAAEYYGLPYARMNVLKEIEHPEPGWYAISAHVLRRPQLRRDSDVRFDWLDRFEPEAVIGHSIYVYHFEG